MWKLCGKCIYWRSSGPNSEGNGVLAYYEVLMSTSADIVDFLKTF
jgi:hypothetical protein